MLGLLADANTELHVSILLNVCRSKRWRLVWDALSIDVLDFRSLGIQTSTPDDVLWHLCQARQIVLITANRNQSGPDSLQGTILRESTIDSLPVITIGDPRQLQLDNVYRERAADRLIEILFDMERIRGAGRMYIP